MVFAIAKASDHKYRELREIADFDEMVALFREFGTVIVGRDYDGDAEFEIMIYDDYVE
jgi:hypothetical protein